MQVMEEPNRIKLVGSDSVGSPPKEFSDDNDIAQMKYHIHNFANRGEKRGECFCTGAINAHGHPWKLMIFPRGDNFSKTDTEYVSVYLVYAGENTKTDPVVAKAMFQTMFQKGTTSNQLPKYEYCNEDKKRHWGWANFCTRTSIITNYCNDAGTLTITVELQVATEKKSVWYPQPTYYDRTGSQLFRSTENSDVLFTVGNTSKEYTAHKCILALRARSLYELVLVEESSSKDSAENDTNIELRDVEEKVFETLLEFVYTGKEPKLDADEDTVRSLLLAANRFGCTDLKLYAESILVDKFLVPSNAAALLLFADSYSCALLKEATMNTYINDTKAVIESKDDWTKLKESNDLLVELLLYSTSGRKKYSSIVDDGNASIDRAIVDADDLNVTSLRERLQKVDLDVDGSREILVERWREYLRTKNNE